MSALYHLPLTHESCVAFFEQQQPLPPIEASALFAAFIRLGAQSSVSLDRLIHDAYPLFRDHPSEGHAQLLTQLKALPFTSVQSFVDALLDRQACLVTPNMLSEKQWLGRDGNYAFEFQGSCSPLSEAFSITIQRDGQDPAEDGGSDLAIRTAPRTLVAKSTREQAVVARVVASAPGERIAIDAYAGTGKTFLVHALQEGLSEGFTYIAPTDAHLYGYRQAGSSLTKRAMTLGDLAVRLYRSHARSAGLTHVPSLGKAMFSLAEQARFVGVQGIGGRSAATVMQQLLKAVNTWCYSDDDQIGAQHFRRAQIYGTLEMERYIHAAKQLWSAMFAATPRGQRFFALWHVHVAKWLITQRAEPSVNFGTLLVDEAHDLPPVWHALFGAYAGGCVLLGDPHQKLRGRINRPERFQTSRMLTSFRVGLGADALIEHTLGLAPKRDMTEFRTTRDHVTRLHLYGSAASIPDHGLRLYGNEWQLLAASLRLKAQGAPIGFLPASEQILDYSVRDAITLFADRAIEHDFEVNGCRDLSALTQKFEDQGLNAITRLFERGFRESDLIALKDYAKASGPNALMLGLLDHAKNLEFETVSLSPCCFDDGWKRRGFQPIHAAYLGMSRARHALWVPGDTRERLSDLA